MSEGKKIFIITVAFLIIASLTFIWGIRTNSEFRENIGMESLEKLEYYKMLTEWNLDAAKGKLRPRLNNEILVYEIEKEGFNYLGSHGNDTYGYYTDEIKANINRQFFYVTLINTNREKIDKCWIEGKFIRYPKSNWGLTQDLWQVDKRVAQIEKGDTKVADNPFKPENKKKGRK